MIQKFVNNEFSTHFFFSATVKTAIKTDYWYLYDAWEIHVVLWNKWFHVL